MQLHKLPSGTIVNLDDISRISQPKEYPSVPRSCEYICGGYSVQAQNADADALYAAVDALVCNPTPVAQAPASVYRIVDSTAMLADTLGHVDKVRERLRTGIIGPKSAANELTLILYTAGWDEIEVEPVADTPAADSDPDYTDKPVESAMRQIAKLRDTMTAYSHTWIKDQLTRILEANTWEERPAADSEPHGNVAGRYAEALS